MKFIVTIVATLTDDTYTQAMETADYRARVALFHLDRKVPRLKPLRVSVEYEGESE
jgi:hypothetical protein